MKIKIADIVESISGEIGLFPQGSWCTIIRFAGCNLCCPYCDTKETWTDENAVEMSVDEIMRRVHTKNVLITGGEPFVQSSGLDSLVDCLMKNKHTVQIETNGSLPVSSEVAWWLSEGDLMLVIDYKGPSSRQEMNFKEFIDRYSFFCQEGTAIIKMVVSSYDDIFAMNQFRELFDSAPNTILAFSPVDGQGYWTKYIIDVLEEEFPFELANGQIILSIQIHKLCMLP